MWCVWSVRVPGRKPLHNVTDFCLFLIRKASSWQLLVRDKKAICKCDFGICWRSGGSRPICRVTGLCCWTEGPGIMMTQLHSPSVFFRPVSLELAHVYVYSAQNTYWLFSSPYLSDWASISLDSLEFFPFWLLYMTDLHLLSVPLILWGSWGWGGVRWGNLCWHWLRGRVSQG